MQKSGIRLIVVASVTTLAAVFVYGRVMAVMQSAPDIAFRDSTLLRPQITFAKNREKNPQLSVYEHDEMHSLTVQQRGNALDRLVMGQGQYNTVAQNSQMAALFNGDRHVVPGLTRALIEQPHEGRVKAASVLMAVGRPAADDALPALVIATAKPDAWSNNDHYLSETLTRLAGGPEALSELLRTLLKDPHVNVRSSAAQLLGNPGGYTSNNMVRRPDGTYAESDANLAVKRDFDTAVVALAQMATTDTDASARMAALNALTATYNKPPCDKALPILAAALPSRPLDERQAILHIFATAPILTATDAAAIRPYLSDTDSRSATYASLALNHAAQIDSIGVQQSLVDALHSQDASLRRNAVQQMAIVMPALWGYNPRNTEALRDPAIASDQALQGWYAPPSVAQMRSMPANQQRESLRRKTLIAALRSALSDSDAQVRVGAAQSLESIGKSVNESLGFGGYAGGPLGAVKRDDRPDIVPALQAAQKATASADPALSTRLAALAQKIQAPHDVI